MSNKKANKILLKIHDKTLEKRNTSECYRIVYTREAINDLDDYYSKLHGLPQAVRNFTMLRSSYHTEISKKGLIEMFHYKKQTADQRQFSEYYGMISPNPAYFPLDSDPLTAKDEPDGTGVIVWFFHPRQMQSSKIKYLTNDQLIEFSNNVKRDDYINSQLDLKRSNSQESISNINKNTHTPYLASILNLDICHIDFLKYIKRKALDYIKSRFGVDIKKDYVTMYAHFPYMESMVTFHLHVRINQGFHPLEKEHSMMIDDMINILESGKSIRNYIIEKAVCYDELEAGEFLSSLNLSGIKIERVKNPFYLSSEFVLNPLLKLKE